MTKRRLAGLFLLLCATIACADSSSAPVPLDYEAEGLDVPLPKSQVEQINRVVTTGFRPSEVLLPNGRPVKEFLDQYGFDVSTGVEYSFHDQERLVLEPFGPQTQKNLIIALMTAEAWLLTDRSLFTFPEEESKNGVLRPPQRGLAYSWGAKDYSRRMRPSGGACRDHAAVYGLDCSGFLYHLALAAGLRIPRGTANRQRRPETWNEILSPRLPKLSVVDLDAISPSNFETGDLVYWFGNPRYPEVATHIAIVLRRDNGELAVFMSSGFVDGNCEQNYGPSLGPIQKTLDDPYWFGGAAGPWGVLRMVTDISGEWLLYGRCIARETDAYSVGIELTTAENQQVSGFGEGVDYDGSPITVEVRGEYTKADNLLSAELDYSFLDNPAEDRVDRFDRRLNEDDTGYFPVELVYHSGTGCEVAVRLVNQEQASLPTAAIDAQATGDGGVLAENGR